jgi:peroxiredoxin Q/BCP
MAACAVLALAAMANSSLAGDQAPKVGEKAPAFESVDENGKVWKSSDHIGKKIIVLYFYPADFTGGCTAQACAFRDNFEALSKHVEVVGISGDSPKNHVMFKAYNKLPFTLLADENGDVAKKFGVKVGKGGKNDATDEKGNKVQISQNVRIARVTVIIDKQGNIAAIDPISKAGDDAKRVQEIVERLEKK